MDPLHQPERDHNPSVNDEEMQIEATSTASESPQDLNEVEMQIIDDSTDSNDLTEADFARPALLMLPTTPSLPSSTPASAPSTVSSPTPPALQRRSTRRSRVDDDNDEERDRRHPSHRVNTPSQSSSPTSTSSSSTSPSQTTSSPTNRTRPALDIPGIFRFVTGRAQGPPGPASPAPRPFRFFQHMMPPNHPNHPASVDGSSATANTSPTANSTANSISDQPLSTSAAEASNSAADSGDTNMGAAAPEDPSPNANAPNLQHQYLGGFAITIDMLGNMTTVPLVPGGPANASAGPADGASAAPANAAAEPLPAGPVPEGAENGTDHSEGQAQAQTTAGNGSDGDEGPGNGNSAATFAEFLARIGLLATLGMQGMGLEREVEDPERAKKLIEGLEDVPVGLIRRLERVGGTGGGMGQDLTGGGDSGCAICWEKLLIDNDEAEAGKEGGESKETMEEQEEKKPMQEGENSSSGPSRNSLEAREYPRIVSLPCAHVFHADCLIPWFSRPKQTTCPSCRFNIDPENLTYTSRAQRRRAAETQTPTRNDEEGAAADANAEGAAAAANPGATTGALNLDDNGSGLPFFFNGLPPIVIPLQGGRGGTEAPSQPEANGAPVQGEAPAQPDSQAAQPRPETATDPASTPGNNTGNNPPFREFVTIGFDMYIGRGPPPTSPLRSPPATPSNAATTATNAPANASQTTEPTRPPRQGGGAGGAGGGTTWGGFTLPIPLNGMGMSRAVGVGVGRAIGEVIHRMFGPAGSGEGTGSGGTGNNTPQNVDGPVVFGPERPPVPFPGSLSTNVGVGIGLGAGAGTGTGAGNAQRQQQGFPPILPFRVASFPIPSAPAPAVGAQVPPPQPQTQTTPQQQQQQQQREGDGLQFFADSIPLFDFFGAGLRPPQDNAQGDQPMPKRKWTPPPAPGLTLRQKIEKKEQEAGLRCCDVSCGVGPSDEDPWVDATEQTTKQLSIMPLGTYGASDTSASAPGGAEAGMPVCPHTFHSSCLVSTERVALALRDAEVTFVGSEGKETVEVSCPVCRGAGRVSKEEWDAGVQALS